MAGGSGPLVVDMTCWLFVACSDIGGVEAACRLTESSPFQSPSCQTMSCLVSSLCCKRSVAVFASESKVSDDMERSKLDMADVIFGSRDAEEIDESCPIAPTLSQCSTRPLAPRVCSPMAP